MRILLIIAMIAAIALQGCDKGQDATPNTLPAGPGEADLTISQGTVGRYKELSIGVMRADDGLAGLALHIEDPLEDIKASLKTGESAKIGRFKVGLVESEGFLIPSLMPGQPSGKVKVRVYESEQDRGSAASPREETKESIYFGVIPCADCPGINYTLILKQDGTYTESMIYQERNDDKPFVTEGTWKTNTKDSRKLLALTPDEEGAQTSLLEQVSAEEIRLLDGDGNPLPPQLNSALKKR